MRRKLLALVAMSIASFSVHQTTPTTNAGTITTTNHPGYDCWYESNDNAIEMICGTPDQERMAEDQPWFRGRQ